MKAPGCRRALISISCFVLLVPLLAACAAGFSADPSTKFGPSSEKAIVVLGTNANSAQIFNWSGQSLSTFWQEYDPAVRQLVKGGASFQTKILKGSFAETDYRTPTVTVLEVDPGDYALTAAGFPHLMTLFVRAKENSRLIQADTYVVDPRKYVDPEARVDPQKNFLFSVEPGQIVYIGHFEFVKLQYLDQFISINYVQDPAAAREALKKYPGIRGEMAVLDLRQPVESAELYP